MPQTAGELVWALPVHSKLSKRQPKVTETANKREVLAFILNECKMLNRTDGIKSHFFGVRMAQDEGDRQNHDRTES